MRKGSQQLCVRKTYYLINFLFNNCFSCRFTVVTSTTFTYRGGEVFTFKGDDDVFVTSMISWWVFMQVKLPINLEDCKSCNLLFFLFFFFLRGDVREAEDGGECGTGLKFILLFVPCTLRLESKNSTATPSSSFIASDTRHNLIFTLKPLLYLMYLLPILPLVPPYLLHPLPLKLLPKPTTTTYL
jgi:hypothetical protein